MPTSNSRPAWCSAFVPPPNPINPVNPTANGLSGSIHRFPRNVLPTGALSCCASASTFACTSRTPAAAVNRDPVVTIDQVGNRVQITVRRREDHGVVLEAVRQQRAQAGVLLEGGAR